MAMVEVGMTRRQFVRLQTGLKTMTESIAWAEANHLVGFEAHSSPDGAVRGSGEVEVSEDEQQQKRKDSMKREVAQHHLTETVAHMIWFSVECTETDRAAHDWRHAEAMVNGPLHWMVDAMANPWDIPPGFARAFWCSSFMADREESYDEFKKRFWDSIWTNFRYHREDLQMPPYACKIFNGTKIFQYG